MEFLVENITKFSQWNYLAIQKSPMRKGKFLTETFFEPVSFFLLSTSDLYILQLYYEA